MRGRRGSLRPRGRREAGGGGGGNGGAGGKPGLTGLRGGRRCPPCRGPSPSLCEAMCEAVGRERVRQASGKALLSPSSLLSAPDSRPQKSVRPA